jgi:hypothetical protein
MSTATPADVERTHEVDREPHGERDALAIQSLEDQHQGLWAISQTKVISVSSPRS